MGLLSDISGPPNLSRSEPLPIGCPASLHSTLSDISQLSSDPLQLTKSPDAVVKAGSSAKSNSSASLAELLHPNNRISPPPSAKKSVTSQLESKDNHKPSIPALDESPSCHGNGVALILAKDYLSSFEPTNCDKEMWNNQFADANFFDSFNSQPGQGHGEFTTPATAEHYGTTAKYFQNHEVNSSLFQTTAPTQKMVLSSEPAISVNNSFVAFETPVDQSLSTEVSSGTGELFPPSQNQPSPLETAIDPEAPTSFNSFSLENSDYLPRERTFPTTSSNTTAELFPPFQNRPSPLETAIDPEAPTFFNSFSLENSNYLPREKTFPTTSSNTTAELFPPFQNQPSPLVMAIDPEAPPSFNSFSLENSNYLHHGEDSSTTTYLQLGEDSSTTRSNTTAELFPPFQNRFSPLETAIDREAPTSFNSFSLENSNYLPREKTFPTTCSNTTAELFPPFQYRPSPLETAIDPETPPSSSLENSSYFHREETLPTTCSNTIGELFPPFLNHPSSFKDGGDSSPSIPLLRPSPTISCRQILNYLDKPEFDGNETVDPMELYLPCRRYLLKVVKMFTSNTTF